MKKVNDHKIYAYNKLKDCIKDAYKVEQTREFNNTFRGIFNQHAPEKNNKLLLIL